MNLGPFKLYLGVMCVGRGVVCVSAVAGTCSVIKTRPESGLVDMVYRLC